MDEFKKLILEEMVRVFQIFRSTRIIELPDKKHLVEDFWISEDAEKYYENLCKILEQHEVYKWMADVKEMPNHRKDQVSLS